MIHHGDLFDVLPTLADASIDACVTDGPYGIGFMNRKWDTFKPENIRKQAQMKQRKDQALIANIPNIYGRMRSPAQSPSQIEYDYSVKGLREFQIFTEAWAREVFRVLKPGAYIVSCGAPRAHHRMMCGLEDAGFEIRDCLAWLFGSGFPKSRKMDEAGTKGTALKPANEPIALAWKPFKGSITDCHETHGTAALNISDCRLEGTPRATGNREGEESADRNYAERGSTNFAMKPGPRGGDDMGRWPANVVIDEQAAAAIDEQTGDLTSGGTPESRSADKFRNTYGTFKGGESENGIGRSIGGASRFYYCAKPSREERDMGCHDLAPKQRDDSRKEGNPGGDNPRNRGLQPRGNYHPTVKPVELMRWLVRLVTPINGVVLDPFTGSGTTGMACVFEQRQFIGIEREAEYVAIAERRIASVAPLFTESA